MLSSKTMKSWPKAIHSVKDLPEKYVKAFEELSYERFPYSIFIPADINSKEVKNENLISLFPDKIVIFEEVDQKIKMSTYEFMDIVYIEFGVILLYSWFKVHGISEGVMKTSNITFNSVQEELFNPIIKTARKVMLNCDGDEVYEEQRLDYLKKTKLKLYNYAKRAVLLGETILHTIYQPKIHEHLFKLFNKVKSETSVLLLTKKELIIVHEPEQVISEDENIGVVWQYIPLAKIDELFIMENKEETLYLVLRLKNGEQLKFLYSILNLKDLEELRALFKSLKK